MGRYLPMHALTSVGRKAHQLRYEEFMLPQICVALKPVYVKCKLERYKLET